MAGIILLEAVESLQPKQSVQSTSERSLSLVDLGKKLLESARLGETEEVRQLMTNGAPFTTDWLGTSPLHMAAQFGHISTAEVLIRAGISRDARTKVDRTPLHVAAQEGHADIVELLLKNGADIEAKDMLKMTPLHWAVERGHVQVIELLLEYDADIHSMSKFEKTPVSVALDNGRLDIVQLLTSGQTGKRTALDETEESTALLSTTKLDENELEASVEEQEDVTLHTAAGTVKGIPVRPILLHANLSNIKNEKDDSDIEEETNDQGSTSVLATLAALAETMGPLTAQAGNGVSAAETLQWLEQHGITMLSGDNSTIITSALESGQTISLTEAGKLALNWTKKQNSSNSRNADAVETSTLEQTIENVVANMSNQKVITIVTDQSQIPSLVSGASSGSIVVMANSDLDPSGELMSVTLDSTQEDVTEPETKKIRRGPVIKDENIVDDLASLDRDQLAQRLEEAQRKAKEYEEQLRMKEHEAAEYKKRLDSISSQALVIKK